MHITVRQGKTQRHAIPLLNTGFNPQGWTVRSQVRPREDSVTVFHEWSTVAGTAGLEVIPADQLTAAGHQTTVPRLCVVLTTAPTVSAAWQWTAGVFDIELSNGTQVLPVGDRPGTVTVRQEVTR